LHKVEKITTFLLTIETLSTIILLWVDKTSIFNNIEKFMIFKPFTYIISYFINYVNTFIEMEVINFV